MSDLCGARLCLADAQGHKIYNSRSTAIIPYCNGFDNTLPLNFVILCGIIIMYPYDAGGDMMRYRLAVFDFDLTLADSTKPITECFKYTLDKFGYPPVPDEEIFATIGKTLLDSFDILTGIPNNPQREEMRVEYVKKADTVMAAGTEFYPDAIAILHILQNAGVKTAIVSSKMKYRIEETFMLHTGSVPVDLIIGLNDTAAPKPAPDGIIRAGEMLGVPLEDTLYIGDNLIDAETARNAGVDFAAVTTGSTTREEFESLPHICIGGSLLEIFTSINNNE